MLSDPLIVQEALGYCKARSFIFTGLFVYFYCDPIKSFKTSVTSFFSNWVTALTRHNNFDLTVIFQKTALQYSVSCEANDSAVLETKFWCPPRIILSFTDRVTSRSSG